MFRLLLKLAMLLFAIGVAGTAVGFAASKRGRWTAVGGPSLIGIAGVVWHKLALLHFAGDTFLVYGYFEQPPGVLARPWIITAPWYGVLIGLLVFCVTVSLVFGLRGDDAAVVTSWLSSLLVLAAFSAFIGLQILQGDAAIFI